jgi:hypothetical protein
MACRETILVGPQHPSFRCNSGAPLAHSRRAPAIGLERTLNALQFAPLHHPRGWVIIKLHIVGIWERAEDPPNRTKRAHPHTPDCGTSLDAIANLEAYGSHC